MADDRRTDHLYTLNRDHELKNHTPAHGRVHAGVPSHYLTDLPSSDHPAHLSPQTRLSPHNSVPLPTRPPAIPLVPGLGPVPLPSHSLHLASHLSPGNSSGLLSVVGPPPLAPITQYASQARGSPAPQSLSRVSPKPTVIWESPGPPNPPQMSPRQSLGGIGHPSSRHSPAENRQSPSIKRVSPNPKLPYNRASPKSQLGVGPVMKLSPGSQVMKNSPGSRNSPHRASPVQQRLSPATGVGTHALSPLSIRVSPVPNTAPHINSRLSPAVIPKVIVQPPPGGPVFRASGLVQLPQQGTSTHQTTSDRIRTLSPAQTPSSNKRDRQMNTFPHPSFRSSPDIGIRGKANENLAPLPAHSHPSVSPPRQTSPAPLSSLAPPPAVLPEDLSIRTVKSYSPVHSQHNVKLPAHHLGTISGGSKPAAHLDQKPPRIGSPSNIPKRGQSELSSRQPALAQLLKAPVLNAGKSSSELMSEQRNNPVLPSAWSTVLTTPNSIGQRSEFSNSLTPPTLCVSNPTQCNRASARTSQPGCILPKPSQPIPSSLTKSLTEMPSYKRPPANHFGVSDNGESEMPRLYPQRMDSSMAASDKVQAFVFEPQVKVENDHSADNSVKNVSKQVAEVKEEVSSEEVKDTDLHCSPFNMRVTNLSNLQAFTSQTSFRSNYRTHSMALLRAKTGSICNPAKSLDILRQNLQKHINEEIDKVVQKYITEYFEPAMENIRQNNGDISTEHLLAVCRQILEESKKLYQGDTRMVTPDVADSVSEAGSSGLPESRTVRDNKRSLFNIKTHKRRGSSDSDASIVVKKRKGRPPLGRGSGRSTPQKTSKNEPVRKEGPKWDPDRLKGDTQFVMGARANKALGFGATRGRLYIKHPDIFKYAGDQDDKTWLYEHGHMPATGGKTYLLLVEDIMEISELDEYKNGGSLLMNEVVGFSVPEWMLQKMKAQMLMHRTDYLKSSKARAPAIAGRLDPEHSQEKDEVVGQRNGEERLPFTSSKYSDNHENLGQSRITDGLDNSGDGEEEDPSTMSPLNMTGGFNQLDEDLSPAPNDLSPAPSDITNGGEGLEEDIPLTGAFHIPIGS